MAKAIKIELIKTLPSDPAIRARLANIVQDGVDALKDIKLAQGSLADVLAITKQDLNIDPKFLRTLINFEYDQQEAAQKKRAALDEQIEQLTDLEILMGRKKSDDDEDGE